MAIQERSSEPSSRGCSVWAWAQWGAAGLTGDAAALIRAGGIAVGLLIIGSSVGLRRTIPDARPTAEGADAGASRSMFRSPGHRLVVVLEVVALVGGGALLAATGHAEYTIAWYAGVVGLHFLVFGRLYWAGFYLVGGALVATGVAGAIAGLLGGSPSAVKATSGLGPRQSCSRPAAGPCSRHGPAAARDPGRPRRSQTRSVRGGAVRAMTCPASDAAPARE